VTEIIGFAGSSGVVGVSVRRGLDDGFRIGAADEGATFEDAGTAVAFIGVLSIALRGRTAETHHSRLTGQASPSALRRHHDGAFSDQESG
jgi:hypothetical protein